MRLLFALGALLLIAATPFASKAQTDTVYFYAWGGNPAVNEYLRWAARELRKENIELRHVKVADIADVITQIRDGRSNADLLWINGENFHALKAANKLYPIAQEVANVSNIREGLNWQIDFGEPVENLEVPWGIGQFHLLSCNACIETPNISATTLLDYAENNRGKISYPKPPQFHGTTFLKALLLSLHDNEAVFQEPVDSVDAETLTQPLWDYLEKLHPLLWQQGKRFPASAAEMLNWFANSRLHIAVSFNPNEVETLVRQGRVPEGTQRIVLGDGAITNHHYLAIPTTAAAKSASIRAINFFLSEEAQLQKAQLGGWGDPAVIPLPAGKDSELLPVAADFHASWQVYLEQSWLERFQ